MNLPTQLPDNNPTITVEIDTLTAFCLVAQVQLATRHHWNTGESRKRAEEWIKLLQETVAEAWPDFRQVLEMGWNPEYDQPTDTI